MIVSATRPPPTKLRRFFALELLDNRYPALHGLRVLGILSVVQFHVTWIFGGERGIKLDTEFFQQSLAIFFGMDLFFILSGFLIGSILLRSLEDNGTQQLRRFYVRRAFRTFPAYYVVLFGLALVLGMSPLQKHNLIYEIVYLTNFMPLGRTDTVMFWGWSLALEEQFYLTVPLLFFVLYRLRSARARVVVLTALWSVALMVRIGIYLAHRPWADLALYSALYFRTYCRFDTLVAGLILAVVHRRWREPITRWLCDPFHRALLALPALACLWLLLFPTLFGTKSTQLFHLFAWGTITSVMYFCTLLLMLHSEGTIGRVLSAPIFRRVATLGYGVYLVHIPLCDHLIVPAAQALDARHVSKLILWPASFAALMLVSIALSYVLHVLVEKPALRIREWIAG